MRQTIRITVLAIALSLISIPMARAQTGTIERIEVQGLYRMTREAFMHALAIDVGDAYDEGQIRRRFKALWDLGLFEDIVVESEDAPGGGKLLVFKVRERPVLTSVTYEDNKVATTTQIEDRLKERDIQLKLGKPIDMGDIFFAETAIRDLLAEKGFLDAEVESEVRRVTETTRAVNFRITPGGKTRIRKIVFEGNTVFTDRRLRAELELTQERKWYWPWSSKNLYHPAKWDQDVTKVRELYQNLGYLDVEIRPPRLDVRSQKRKQDAAPERTGAAPAGGTGPGAPGEPGTVAPEPAASEAGTTTDAGTAAEADRPQALPEDDPSLTTKERRKLRKQRERAEKKARKKRQKVSKVKNWVELTVPITEGEQYRLGEVTISGNEVFTTDELRGLVPLKEGDIVRNGWIDASMDQIRLLYANRGHLYASVVRQVQRREDEKIADLSIVIDEDEPYYVSRIEFRGNTATHDRVLRRELLMMEGELFSRSRLDISRAKINQLGYFQVTDEPVIEPIEGENRVNISIAGEEQGRNEIQVGGGYSGLDGAFFNGVYSTRNFLGRGQIVSLSLQVGGRSSRYQLSFQEPWFLGRPYLLGASVFRRDYDYGNSLQSTSTGMGLVLGRRVGRFSNVNLSYNWQSVSSRTVLTTATEESDAVVSENKLNISSVTPFFSFSTINNPYRPTAGRSFSFSTQVAGGPLGGDAAFLKPIVNFTQYHRATRKTYFGFHAEAGLVRPWRGGSGKSGSNVLGIPRYERFWLGGDTIGPRVFETRTITPLRYVVLENIGTEENPVNAIGDVLGDPRYLSPSELVTSGGIPALVEAGGDRYFLLQNEFVFPFNEQAELAFFVDVGDALFEDQSWGFETARVSAGVELRFHLPIFPVPLRLIYGVPVRKLERDRTSNFTFSIGRSF